MRSLRALAVVLLVGLFPIASQALTININYVDSATDKWTDAMKVVVADAVKEWEKIFCPKITVFVDFTWEDLGTTWGVTRKYYEDPFLHLPFSADLELNSAIKSQYYWDATPGNVTDDAGKLKKTGDSSIDAASVLKHELAHAIGFSTGYSKFRDMKRKDGDLDKDGKDEYYLDFNGNRNRDDGETVLSDNGTNHTDDGFYNKKESFLMGDGGFGRGDQARPDSVIIGALHGVYDYPIHPVPLPAAALMGLPLMGALVVFGRHARGRRR